MGTLEQKEKELLSYLDTIVARFLLSQEHFNDTCSKRECRIIDILGRRGLLMMTDIAEEAMLSLSTVTGIVDSLVEKRMVRRERSEEDRRVVRVELTAEGRKMYRQQLEARLRLVQGMLTSLNKGEQDALINLFRKIVQRIEAEKEAPVA